MSAANPKTGPAANKHQNIAHATCVTRSARDGSFGPVLDLVGAMRGVFSVDMSLDWSRMLSAGCARKREKEAKKDARRRTWSQK